MVLRKGGTEVGYGTTRELSELGSTVLKLGMVLPAPVPQVEFDWYLPSSHKHDPGHVTLLFLINLVPSSALAAPSPLLRWRIMLTTQPTRLGSRSTLVRDTQCAKVRHCMVLRCTYAMRGPRIGY